MRERSTIPAMRNLAITVGSAHRDMPHTYGVSFFSGKGPTADGRMKPDLVAPGERIVSCARMSEAGGDAGVIPFMEDSGTSMAAPHVSGAIAAFLSVRTEFIGQTPGRQGPLLRQRHRPQAEGGISGRRSGRCASERCRRCDAHGIATRRRSGAMEAKMDTLGPSPFCWLEFDAKGGLVDAGAPAAIKAMLNAPGVNDVVVMSHGWKNTKSRRDDALRDALGATPPRR